MTPLVYIVTVMPCTDYFNFVNLRGIDETDGETYRYIVTNSSHHGWMPATPYNKKMDELKGHKTFLVHSMTDAIVLIAEEATKLDRPDVASLWLSLL